MDQFPISVSFSKSIGEINDRIEVHVSPNDSLVDLSKLVCQRVGIDYSNKYEFITLSKLQLSMANDVKFNNIVSNAHLVLIDKEVFDKDEENNEEPITKVYQDIMWKPLAIVASFLSIAGLVVLLTIYIINLSSIYTYSVVIDAGSTSSKIYLYNWASNKFSYNADVIQLAICKTDNGISDYEWNPNDSFVQIKYCLDNKIIPMIPKKEMNNTLLYLGATAGMRMLSHNSPNATNQIMSFLRDSIVKYPFKVNNAKSDIKIISGYEEGIYGWITINYLLKTLSKNKEDTDNVIGALDMGGASSEISFLHYSSDNKTNVSNLKLFGKSFSIYSHSYLCYGKSQAEYRSIAQLIEKENFSQTVYNPCMTKGESHIFKADEVFNVPCVMGKFALDHYGHEIVPPSNWLKKNENLTVIGTSNSSKCEDLVLSLFNETACKENPCTFNGVYQPEISGKFGAFSAYNLIKTILNKNGDISDLKDYKHKLKNLCDMKTNDSMYLNSEDIWTKWRCFDLTYMMEMLMKLGFNESNWKYIDFLDKIDGSSVGWALGFMINKTSIIPKGQHFLPIENYLFIILLVALLIIMIFSFVFIYFFCLKRKRNRKYVNYSSITEEESLLS